MPKVINMDSDKNSSLVEKALLANARSRAQGRALGRLRKDDPERYKKYYEEELDIAREELGI